MRIIYKVISLLFIISFLSACSNALYFYETDKIALTVEARPDSSQPIQGSLGIKQRIGLVTPSKGAGEGEALSSISSFRFNMAPIPADDFFNGFNPVLIRTAFLTGDAAKKLTEVEAATAAMIITDTSSFSGNDFIYMRNLISVLNKHEAKGIPDAIEIIRGLNKISEQISPDIYPVSTYAFLSPIKKLSESHTINSPITFTKNFNGLWNFLGELHLSKKAINEVLKKPQDYIVLNSSADKPIILNGLQTTITNTENAMKSICDKLKNEPVYNLAIQYYINHIILKGES